MQDINAEKQYVIYSPNESATCSGAGFWNNEDGWTEFDEATLFTEAEARSLNLPTSVGNDARFVEKSAAWEAYCGEQDTQIAHVRLTADVDYALGDESADDMRAFLERSTRMAIGNGMLSGDTSAEVDEYSLKVERRSDAAQNEEVARVRLSIDVSYDLNEETAEDMRDFLERAAFSAIGNGMLSGDTSAVVDTYRMNVDVVLAGRKSVALRPANDSGGSIAKVEHLIKRKDGSEVKVVAQECFGEGLTRSVDVYVLRRDGPDSQWSVCSDRPHPDWRSMSVDEYVKRGRSEMLQTVSHGEILKAAIELNKLSKGMGFIVEDTPEMKRRGMRP